jgi:hypothetical protein
MNTRKKRGFRKDLYLLPTRSVSVSERMSEKFIETMAHQHDVRHAKMYASSSVLSRIIAEQSNDTGN